MVSRYGAGELYGFDLSALSAERIRQLASAKYKDMPCPFKPQEPGKPQPKCNKKGGVCSLRQYVQEAGVVTAVGKPVTTCPQRFLERKLIFEWVRSLPINSSVIFEWCVFFMAIASVSK